MSNMRKWSDAKLDKELAFAVASLDTNHKENIEWLSAILLELLDRISGKKKGKAA